MSNPLFDSLFDPHSSNYSTFLHLSNQQTISYAEFVGQAAQYANALTAIGVSPGDRVAVHIKKASEGLALYAGCVQAGAVFLPLNTAYTATELDYFVGDSLVRQVLLAVVLLATAVP